MRNVILVGMTMILLVAVNFNIYQREQLISSGRVVLLELAPVDPRSLMQGDYMALRFKVATEAFNREKLATQEDGHLVVRLDERNVATFSRFAASEIVAENEVLFRYRIRNGRPKFATNAFFFEEGRAGDYEKARYGEFRVAPDGEAILTQLRDKDLTVLGSGNS